ncbi:MAG: hypothetical protein MUC77_15785 [Chromatiaceae bacterium]|jgi:hypothetical protein|nr:hypothetical protein [Chromatiaceae bacterium]
MRSFQITTAVLLAALSIQACDNGQEEPATQAASPPAQAAIDPCDLITRDDAAHLLGEPMLQGERRDEGRVGMTLCLYNPADPDSLGFLQVSINQPGAASSGASPAQIFQDIRDAMSDGRTDLDGLGDAAFIATGGIYVLQGERMISIGAGNTSQPEVRERLREAAEIALERLRQL